MAKAGEITALIPYFGSARMVAEKVGELTAGRIWAGVPFAGGLSEVLHMTCRQIVVNDLHRHVINLARVVAHETHRRELFKRLDRKLFHPDELGFAQAYCDLNGPIGDHDVDAAEAYFVSQWMGRSGKAGTKTEFSGSIPVRWTASGGGSAIRFRSAVRSIPAIGRKLQRCEFTCMDAFDMIAKVKDLPTHCLYIDCPWPEAGAEYLHNFGGANSEIERDKHLRLAKMLGRFKQTLVVVRFGDHPMIDTLYAGWNRVTLRGKDQSGDATHEMLLTNMRIADAES